MIFLNNLRIYKMKKYFGILAVLTLITFFMASVESDANGRNGKGNNGNKGGNNGTHQFVDANGDGVCDNFIDADGDGVCDNCTGKGTGKGNRTGSDFVDADGDGICDNFIDADGDGVCDNCTGNGKGSADGFIDEDGDGVCDNKGLNGNHGSKGQGKGGNGKRLRDGSCDLDVEQNFPNPFLSSTTINVNASESTHAQVVLYDEVGNKIADIYQGNLTAGKNSIEIMPENIKPGIYYYQVVVNGNAVTKRLMYGTY
jgi:hypothetical protein